MEKERFDFWSVDLDGVQLIQWQAASFSSGSEQGPRLSRGDGFRWRLNHRLICFCSSRWHGHGCLLKQRAGIWCSCFSPRACFTSPSTKCCSTCSMPKDRQWWFVVSSLIAIGAFGSYSVAGSISQKRDWLHRIWAIFPNVTVVRCCSWFNNY